MGQEITEQRFRQRDFERFGERLEAETRVLHGWVESDRFSHAPPVAGLELEAWLIRPDGTPAPENETFLSVASHPDVVHELARFNIELNVPPRPLAGEGLVQLQADLEATWRHCRDVAGSLGLDVVSIGTLPTVTDADLCPANMSDSGRYRALNEQVLRQRHGRAIRLDIEGVERLASEHRDVMLEAGTTSFQAHLQVSPENATRYHNASLIASAATVALGANAPFLFGRELWEETRIPLFEQAVAIGSHEVGWHGHLPRVTFGSGYAGWSLAETFQENLQAFPVMLPLDLGEDPSRLPHLRLHNGTIWRWNRPLIGFDADGLPHLRIEHRVMAAGPSLVDMMANLAFYYGLAAELAHEDVPPEFRLPFDAVRDNFYAAARAGLDAVVAWTQGGARDLRSLVLDVLLPMAQSGLARLEVDAAHAARMLAIIERRTRSGQTGAAWQRRFVQRHGRDFARLTREYAARQREGAPVHTWDF